MEEVGKGRSRWMKLKESDGDGEKFCATKVGAFAKEEKAGCTLVAKKGH